MGKPALRCLCALLDQWELWKQVGPSHTLPTPGWAMPPNEAAGEPPFPPSLLPRSCLRSAHAQPSQGGRDPASHWGPGQAGRQAGGRKKGRCGQLGLEPERLWPL